MYSGRQPARTALIATFSATTTVLRPAISPSVSSPRSAAPASISAMDFSVGGTTGSPSVQPRSKYASIRLAGSGSPVEDTCDMIPPRRPTRCRRCEGLAPGRGRVLVRHPGRSLDLGAVGRARERRGRGLTGRARPADRLEKVLEPCGRGQPEHHELIVGLVDDLVLDVAPEEARRP